MWLAICVWSKYTMHRLTSQSVIEEKLKRNCNFHTFLVFLVLLQVQIMHHEIELFVYSHSGSADCKNLSDEYNVQMNLNFK